MKEQLHALGDLSKTDILGTRISRTSYEGVARACEQWIEGWRDPDGRDENAIPGRYICVTSVHGIITAVRDPGFRSILNGAAVATPDGMPVVWALRSCGAKGQSRVYGPELMLRLCKQAEALEHRIFLYGGRDTALQELVRRLESRFPRLQLCGYHSPAFRPLTRAEDDREVERLRTADPDIVFVGLSTPKQERWMADHVHRLPRTILIGVGAAFDFHAGTLKQAPPWMQKAGLEWFFRLTMEPRRLWKRYAMIVPLFFPLWALQRGGILRFANDNGEAKKAR